MKQKNNYIFFTIIFLLVSFQFISFGQSGYIYIHKKATGEESIGNFKFSINSGTTLINEITLNDQVGQIASGDIGSSQSGTLWAIGSDNFVYKREINSSLWIQTNFSGAARIDGGANNTCYIVGTNGNVYSYDGGVSTMIYSSSNGAENASDVGSAWDNTPYIIANGNLLYKYSGTGVSGPAGASWSAYDTNTNWFRVDGDPSTGLPYVINSSNRSVFQFSGVNTKTNLGIPSGANSGVRPLDLAIDSNGKLYAIFNSNVASNGARTVFNYISGTTWLVENSSRTSEIITGGLGGQVWSVVNGAIFSRTNNNGIIYWIDNEKLRTNLNDCVSMLEVSEGIYIVTENSLSGWKLSSINIYDPTGNSSSSVPLKSASINVVAGEVVHVEFENTFDISKVIGGNCGLNIIQDFGTGIPIVNTGDIYSTIPLTGLTNYHFSPSLRPGGDGRYALAQTTSNWIIPGSLTDHTGLMNGQFLMVNASYGADEFFRQRITGLVPGLSYTLSFWAADISNGTNLRPSIVFGIEDISSGNNLASLNTGNISNTSWKQFSMNFIAATSEVSLYIRNNGSGGAGNDVAIDDIGFNLSSPPAPVTSVLNNTCSSTVGSITITSPTSPPNVEFSIDGVNYQTSPTFSGLSAGFYTINARYLNTNCASFKNDTLKVAICGKLFQDDNALTDNIVNGVGTNAGGMKGVLYNNTLQKVTTILDIPASGIIDFGGVGIPSNDYSIYITNANTVLGQTNSPVSILPVGYNNIGEHIGLDAGDDGSVNGILPLGVITGNVINANLGIQQIPNTAVNLQPSSPNPGGVVFIDVPNSSFQISNVGSNPNTADFGEGKVLQINIPTFPTGITSIIVNAIKYFGTDPIWNFGGITIPYSDGVGPNQAVSFDPIEGVINAIIPIVAIDNVGAKDPTPGSITFPFTVTTLPLNLISFKTDLIEDKIILNWKTSNEKDFSHFIVQRSNNTNEFGNIGQISGNQLGNYSYIDLKPNEGENYYRLKMIDLDGSFNFSKIVVEKFEMNGNYILVENPALNGYLNINTNLENPKFNILNTAGNKIDFKIEKNSINNYSINTLNTTSGIYSLIIESKNKLISKKVFIQ